MKDKDFLEVSDFVKKKETELLLPGVFRKAVATESFSEALLVLGQDFYDFSQVETFSHVEELLGQETESLYQMMYDATPYPGLVDILAIRYEFESLKTAFFSYLSFTTSPPVYLDIGRISPSEYAAFFQHQDPFESGLPDYLLKPAQTALRLIEEGKAPLDAQQIFQHQMYRQMLLLAEMMDNDYILDLVKTMIDFHNALTLIQVRTQQQELTTLEPLLMEGGKTNLSYFTTSYTKPLGTSIPASYHREFSQYINDTVEHYERSNEILFFHHLFRHILYSLVLKADLIDYGAEIPFAYLLKKEYEIAQIHTLLYGKVQGWTSEDLLFLLHL